MNNEEQKGKFKELLDKLQQESWQLELLISGFAIYGLVGALSAINESRNKAIAFESDYTIFYTIAEFSCKILIINLIIHVIIRGLWIGAIGLRYVSNEIDYKELNYGKRFTNYLKNKVGSFDDYIAKLENYCSILFAVTFLTLFYVIAFFICTSFVLYLALHFFMKWGIFSEFIGTMLLGFFAIFYFIIAFLVFLDFITQGMLKKKEWTSFLYMPIYKTFSYLTLSFLYRPLVYNFLDNKFGRRIAFVLAPLYLTIFYVSTLDQVRSNYLSTDVKSSIQFAKENNYLDLLGKDRYVKKIAIQSKIIEKPFVEVFIPFKKKIEDELFEIDSTLKPEKDSRGLKGLSINITFSNKQQIKKEKAEKLKNKKQDSLRKIYLKTFNEIYTIKIDSINYKSEFIVTDTRKQLGFEVVLPLKNIPEGKHVLIVNKTVPNKKSSEKETNNFAEIPFWYYKN